MNERERADFEYHKKAAEEQLNKMYYGTKGKSQNKGGLTMPSFLASPSYQSGHTKPPHTTATEPKTKETISKNNPHNKELPPKNNTSKNNRSILNLLNFKGIKMDNDRLTLLAICLLLSGEETDELLMLALIYLMI